MTIPISNKTDCYEKGYKETYYMLIKVSIHQEYIRIKNICNRKIMGRWQSCKHQKTVSPPIFGNNFGTNNFGTLWSIEGFKISKARPHCLQ